MAAERKETTSTAGTPPDDYRLHRFLDAVVDVLPEQVKSRGVVMSEHSEALIQVCPEGGANPALRILFWSEGANGGAGQFIDDSTPIVIAAKGVNTPHEFAVSCKGRRIFVAVTGGVAGGQTCRVYVAGYNANLGR